MQLWEGNSREIAERLVGARLDTGDGVKHTSVVIVETEAYGGPDDPASHAANGQTLRNWPMFEAAGTVYVYRSYGLHWCLNIVTGPPGDAQAVLIRAGSVAGGRALMAERRGREDHLADGPGKLTSALGIDGTFDGVHLSETRRIRLTLSERSPEVEWTPRIGISRATERLWRCVAVNGVISPSD